MEQRAGKYPHLGSKLQKLSTIGYATFIGVFFANFSPNALPALMALFGGTLKGLSPSPPAGKNTSRNPTIILSLFYITCFEHLPGWGSTTDIKLTDFIVVFEQIQ